MKLWGFFGLAALGFGVSGCVTDGMSSSGQQGLATAQASLSVAAGATTKVDQYSFITPRCSEVRGIASRVTQRPGYGTVSIRRTRDFSPYPAGNSSARCNSQRVPVWVVLYSPAPGYAGQDRFSYRKSFPNGRSIDVSVNVNVR